MSYTEDMSYTEEMKRIHAQLMSESKVLADGGDDEGMCALDDIAHMIEKTLKHKCQVEWLGDKWSDEACSECSSPLTAGVNDEFCEQCNKKAMR